MSRFYTPWKRDIGLKWVNYVVAKYWKLAFKENSRVNLLSLTRKILKVSLISSFPDWDLFCCKFIFIYSETRTWHDKNIQSKAQYR